jgi:uncharacterized protein YbaP (TraB family)
MKKFISLLIFAAAALTAMTGFAQETPRAILYKVSGNGLDRPSYLLGTHHLAPVSYLDSVAGIHEAFDSVDAVVGELLMTDMPALQQAIIPHMMMPEGHSYESLLSEEDRALLEESLTNSFGVGLGQFGLFHPAALSTMYSQVVYAKAYPEIDLSTHVSIDQHMQDKAVQSGKNVMALETVEDQVYALFRSEPIESKAESLIKMIRHFDFAEKNLKDITEAYYAQDLDRLYFLAFENPEDPAPTSEEAAYALTKERNDKWLLKLPAIMAEQPALIVVGALHLAGGEGLVNQLRQQGYTVDPVK